MKFTQRRAVDPIIASLLLIAIAVAAGIIVYVYVNSLAGGLTSGGGQQVSQQNQLQAYAFNIVCGATNCGATHSSDGTGQVIDLYLKNVGGSATTISSIYVDGNQLTEWSTSSGSYQTAGLFVPNSGQSCFAALPASTTFTISNSANTGTASGTASTCTGTTTLSTTPCTDTNFCLVPNSQTETLTLAAQSSNQIVIGLNAAVTSGTSHTVKIITSTGGQTVFTVTAGRTG
jgi:hypothetical protein